MAVVILDHICDIKFDEEHPPLNNYQSLYYLSNGLNALANIVRNQEIKLSQSGLVFSMGPADIEDMHFESLLPCYFSWFTVSLVNYTRLIGLFDILVKKGWSSDLIKESKNSSVIADHCNKYVREVISDILLWRNKVSAHFAITDPYDADNIALLEYSIMNTVCYLKPYYKAGAAQWSTRGQQADLPSWSLTETYERLIPRYWNTLSIPPIPTT
ncbi:hypothetical protein ACFLXT_03370 [Chloroflexota bacterium]